MEGRGEIDVGMGLLRSHTSLTFTRLLRVYMCLGKEETNSNDVLRLLSTARGLDKSYLHLVR